MAKATRRDATRRIGITSVRFHFSIKIKLLQRREGKVGKRRRRGKPDKWLTANDTKRPARTTNH